MKTLLAVASAGGHWVELQRLAPAFSGLNIIYLTTNNGQESFCNRPVYTVCDSNFSTKIALAKTFYETLNIILKVKPDVIISTGAAPGLAAIILGKLLLKKTVWIDSIANAEKLSSSGKFARHFADIWLTQWEHLATPTGPHYKGKVV